MIRTLDIRNFKCFERLQLSFGRLTLLTGFNGGGKSSAIQPLLLLAQSLEASAQPDTYALNGPLVKLGTFGDVLPSGKTRSDLGFDIAMDDLNAEWTFSANTGARLLTASEVEISSAAIVANLQHLSYVSAARGGLADIYPVPDDATRSRNGVGVDGRFAAFWYDHFVDDEVVEGKRHPGERATSFRKQLDAWLAMVFPGAEANVQLLPQTSGYLLQFRLSPLGEWRRPANTGYGLSYAFPILVALLIAREGDIVVVDSPEAHLHPSAQSQMGRLLAHFAAAGVQTIVESHSDHVLSGARLAVRRAVLSPSDLRIYFFTGASGEGHGVTSPSIDRLGNLESWPDGFFDQSEKDLGELAGWS